MKIILFIILSFWMPQFAAHAQDEEAERRRLEQLELVWRLQDMRTIHDGKLVSLLADRDPLVRLHATMAFGSLQDTTVLPRLLANLNDRDSAVQAMAAFAIGQTGTMLSTPGREALQYELIWKKLGWTRVDPMIIEQLGKFGTEQALEDLMVRYGHAVPRVYPKEVTMSIARLAIRGITNDDAVRYLITAVRATDEEVRWRALYALWRIGDHPEIRYELERIVRLHLDVSPLVRMHLGTLLGKVREPAITLESLLRLADFDPDWRVRVNAVKALGTYDVGRHDAVATTLVRNFYTENDHIAMAALNAFGNSNVRDDASPELLEYAKRSLTQIVENEKGGFQRHVQGEAAVALARIFGEDAVPYVKDKRFRTPSLQARFLEAAGHTGSPEVVPYLRRFVTSRNPLEARAALNAMVTLSNKRPTDAEVIELTYGVAADALQRRDVGVMAAAASALADPLLRRPGSVEVLIDVLASLRLPEDIEPIREIIAALEKLDDPRAVPALRRQIDQPDRTVSFAAAAAIHSITGTDYFSLVPRFSRPLFSDHDFAFLRSLPDTTRVRIETIRGDIVLELYKNVAPFTVMNFLKLARRGFYKGLVFHRVVPNFVIQDGDPRGDGWGGPGYSIRSEFSPLTFDAGAIGMASAGKDTEGSQYFITHSPQPHLDGRYTLFGRVVEGMNIVDRIQIDDRVFDITMND